MINVHCSSCQRTAEVGDYLAGLTVICKHCGQRITVPAASVQIVAAKTEPSSSVDEARRSITPAQATLPPPGPTLTEIATHREPLSVALSHDSTTPDPTLEYVEASLKMGLNVGQIEELLAKRGLDHSEAQAIINDALDRQVRAKAEPLERAERLTRFHRLVIALVGFAYLAYLAIDFALGDRDFKDWMPWALVKLGYFALNLGCVAFFNEMARSRIRAQGVRWIAWFGFIFIEARGFIWDYYVHHR